MKERMQKTLSQVDGCPQIDRSETEWYGGVQTFMWMCEDNIVEVPFDKEHLFERIPQFCKPQPSLQGSAEKQRLWWYRQDVVWAAAPMALDQ